MLYEYAVEPTLLNNWGNFRYFAEKFGVPQGRLLPRYPKHWKRLVYESLSNCGEIERKKIEEGLVRLDDRMLDRKHEWDDQKDWFTNGEAEHFRRPFHAILAKTNPNQRDFVLEGNYVDENHPLWKVSTSPVVARTAREMADCVAPLLRASTKIFLIDPHFGPENPRHRRPLEAFLAVALERRGGAPLEKIEVHTGAKSAADFFREKCNACLPKIIPRGISVRLVRWRQKDGGEKLHNRYILTERGGVSLGVGLDDGAPGETDDVKLLDQETYELRWKQYTNSDPAFDFVDDLIIVGVRKLDAKKVS
jgi:hypothetical protein